MTFDPRIQVRGTFVTNSFLQVDVRPYELTEALKLGFGIQRQWRRLPQENHYAALIGMQIQADTESGKRVLVAEVMLEQIAEVTGYSDEELKDVVELRLPTILMPYVRAQLANVLSQSGYHYLTLPPTLGDEQQRAELVAEPTSSVENEGGTTS
jgi:preprotein translocase subunit SecB